MLYSAFYETWFVLPHPIFYKIFLRQRIRIQHRYGGWTDHIPGMMEKKSLLNFSISIFLISATVLIELFFDVKNQGLNWKTSRPPWAVRYIFHLSTIHFQDFVRHIEIMVIMCDGYDHFTAVTHLGEQFPVEKTPVFRILIRRPFIKADRSDYPPGNIATKANRFRWPEDKLIVLY